MQPQLKFAQHSQAWRTVLLFKNDFFTIAGARYRLLYRNKDTDRAHAINIDDKRAWPREFSWSAIKALPKLDPSRLQLGNSFPVDSIDTDAAECVTGSGSSLAIGSVESAAASANPALLQIEAQKAEAPTAPARVLKGLKKGRVLSDAQKRIRDEAIAMLGNLIDEGKSAPQIFDPKERCQMIKDRAEEANCTVTVLYKHLRQFWLGGQTASALTPTYENCGRKRETVTGGRGAKPDSGRDVYQLTEDDVKRFERVLQSHYLVENSLLTINDTYDELLEEYRYLDGEGASYVKDHGERPSLRQFRYYLSSNYTKDECLRARLTPEEYKQKHREVLGTVLEDCDGIGHYYECDATIADVSVVATHDMSSIIGKPTIYLIIDRKSRLIVGWYVGLENPSWICAMQAMVSIAQDKRAICERLDVKYDAEDWPAHQMYPRSLLADRGELLSSPSDQIVVELGVKIGNLPRKRPEWKPVVECGFKQTRAILQASAPGFEPPENSRLRQAKDYSKGSCLTLQQFEKIILLAIIKHNRDPLPKYALSLSEIGNKILPIPLALWNFDLESDNGRQVEYSEEHVRMALLERQSASVTLNGISFGKCFYASAETSSREWFARARTGAFKVTVAFDRRLVDTIYVYDPKHPEEVYQCTLTSRSEKFKGLSFVEVAKILDGVKGTSETIEQIRRQNKADFNVEAKAVYETAKNELKEARLTTGRKNRRADTAEARAEALRAERQELAALPTRDAQPHAHSSGLPTVAPQLSSVVPVSGANQGSQQDSTSAKSTASSAQPYADMTLGGPSGSEGANANDASSTGGSVPEGTPSVQDVSPAPTTSTAAPVAAPARPLTAAEKLQKRKESLTRNV